MKNKIKIIFFGLILLIFAGCKNLIADNGTTSPGKKFCKLKVSFHQTNSGRAVSYPEISLSDVVGYHIKGYASGTPEINEYISGTSVDVEIEFAFDSEYNMEVVAYKTGDSEDSSTWKDPVLYSEKKVTVTSASTSVVFVLSPIEKIYNGGLLQNIPNKKGFANFTLKLPASRSYSIYASFSVDDNELSDEVLISSGTSAYIVTTKEFNPGFHTLYWYVRKDETNAQKTIHCASFFVATNLTTDVKVDISSVELNPEKSADLSDVAFVKQGESSNLLTSFTSSVKNYDLTVENSGTFNLVVSMGAAAQKITVNKSGGGTIELKSAEFINSGVTLAQKLTYELELAVSETETYTITVVSSNGTNSNSYRLSLTQFTPEDVDVINHPVDTSSMTALPVPITTLSDTQYVITTQAQLFALGTYVNGGGETTGKTFVLGKDIKLTQDWVAIGNTTKAFEGNFDGNNYKVAGININGDFSDAGFLGRVKTATVQNITVEGTIVSISGNYRTAGIVANSQGDTKILNCINHVNVTGDRHVGGILAQAESGTVIIENCINFGDITVGYSHGAGIVGYVSVGSEFDLVRVNNCANYGSISGDYPMAGIGFTYHNLIIANSINNGNVIPNFGTAYSAIGYKSGGELTISNSAYLLGSAGTKTSIGSAPDPETVTSYTHTTGQMGCTLTTAINSNTDVKTMLNSAAGIGTTYKRWIYSSKTAYKGLPMFADTMARLNVVPEEDLYELPITCSLADYASVNASAPNDSGVYSISTRAELQQLQTWSNTAAVSKSTYVLMDDIDLGGIDWTPIGQAKNFNATFDGNGHKIYGLNVNTENENAGLFGQGAGNTWIKNLIVEGSVTGKTNVGGIIGKIGGSTSCIQNCVSNVTVTGTQVSSGVGGIVGTISSSSTVINCVNLNAISNTATNGNANTGGIVGSNSSGKIYNCVNFGNISAYQYLGGINGYGNSYNLNNCYTTGEIQTTNENTNTIGIIDGQGSGSMDCVYYYSDQVYKPLGSSGKTDAIKFNNVSDIASTMNAFLLSTASVTVTINSKSETIQLNSWNYSYNGFPVCVDCSKVD